MFKFIAITLLLGAAAAAPGLIASRIGLLESPASTIHATNIAPIAYVRAPLTYAEPTTLTRYDSISSPLTYTASHQPAIAVNNLAPLAYTAYTAGYPIRYAGFAY